MSQPKDPAFSSNTNGDPSTLTKLLQSLDIDEGCVITDVEEAREVSSSGGVPFQLINTSVVDVDETTKLDSLNKTKDSGLSSRMSQTDGSAEDKAAQSLLLDVKGEAVLNRRLKRISECQYEEPCDCSPLAGLKVFIKILLVFGCLYLFICTLDLLSNAFRLLGGRTAGSIFTKSEMLHNPITGLMIGVMATVLLQSSSTSTSIVITMVASTILPIKPAIPIIMGANIGTTVTNTLVSLAHSMDRKEFRRAFSGAVVHDVFNWLTVLILLPLEYATGYLYHLTNVIVGSMSLGDVKAKKQDLLKKLTKPLTSKIVKVDKGVITAIAAKGNNTDTVTKSLLKEYCTFDKIPVTVTLNVSTTDNVTKENSWEMVNSTKVEKIGKDKCDALFNTLFTSETTAGAVLFIISIITLSLCLYCMVKLLHSLLGGHIAKAARKTINADFPRPFHWLTGYVAIIVGAGMTILVQSSSVFTSALTPLVGVGCLKLERMFPLTLGSNIGTTFTGILAALAAPPETLGIALQLALCHLFFNISGILIFYPIPRLRKIVISTAKYLGRTTATYRWFAIAYLLFMFLLFPAFFLGISMAGKIVFIVVVSLVGAIVLTIVVINVMQRYKVLRNYLPSKLRTWDFLPEFMRSLAPVDVLLRKVFSPLTKCCPQCCIKRCECLKQDDVDMGCIDSDDDDDSVQTSYLPSAASSKLILSNVSPNGKEYNPIFKPKFQNIKAVNQGKKNGILRHENSECPKVRVTLLPPNPSQDETETDLVLKRRSSLENDSESNKSSKSSSGLGEDISVAIVDDAAYDLSGMDMENLKESKI